MPAPLIIAAAVAGGARAVGGIVSAGKKARRQRDLIKRAYKVAQRRQEKDQAYTRQATNENLNARGILNPGAGGGIPASGAIADAYRGKAGDSYDQRRMALSSIAGEQGQSNTLSGQANRDLSSEFYDEQNDLWQQRKAGINATKAGQAQDVVNSIGAGAELGMNVYGAGQALGFGGAPVPATAPAAAAPAAPTNGVTIRGAFNIDPVNPLGAGEGDETLSNYAFHVNKKG